MRNLLCASFFILMVSCNEKQDNYLIRVYEGGDNVFLEKSGYMNTKGDMIIPFGYYATCLTDTIREFGMVRTTDHRFLGINQNGTQLFEVYTYDNGPDYLSDGLFRIVENNKVGYADESGKIVIQPQFTCTNPFKNGEAKVARECQLIPDGEHSIMESKQWIYIDKKGIEIKK